MITSRRTNSWPDRYNGKVFAARVRPMDERQTIIVFAAAVGFLVFSVFMLNVVGLS
jgi:hypothetical protein